MAARRIRRDRDRACGNTGKEDRDEVESGWEKQEHTRAARDFSSQRCGQVADMSIEGCPCQAGAVAFAGLQERVSDAVRIPLGVRCNDLGQ